MSTKEIELYAIFLGKRSVPTSLVMYHTEPEINITINYYLWCVKYKEEICLIDTGFNPETAELRGVANVRHPFDQLAILGINPDEVKTVICTHMHWDHAGGADFFRKATFFVPLRDVEFFSGPALQYTAIRTFVYPEDLNSILRMNYEGRVRFIHGDLTISPGISVHWVGGHTPGLHVVSVETDKGKAILASDICYLYRNIEEDTIPGLYVNLMEALRGLQKLKELASEENMIFPSHDPKICSKFGSADGEIIRVI